MILVFGATGTIGGEVYRQLLERGVPVRAVVREPRKAGSLGEGADVVVADLADPASLPPALEGVDHVFLASPGAQDQPRLEGNLVDAMAGRGGHLVKLAALGYDAAPVDQAIKFAANHARIVQHVRDAGVPHTVLAPSGFMSNTLGSAATVREQGVLYSSSGDGGVGWVDPRDVAAVAVHVLTSDGHDGASYDVTGPESLTHDQIAEQLSQLLGREVRHVDVPAGPFAQNLGSFGIPPWTVEAITELNQLYRAHLAEVVTDEVQKATGRPATTFADFLDRHRSAFA